MPVGSESGQEFPACMGRVISVGGFTSHQGRKYHYGAISNSINFFDEADPVTSAGNSVYGTSFAAPKVSAVISELMAENPSLSSNKIVQVLFDTAGVSGRVYYPGTNDLKYDSGRSVVDLTRARDAVSNDYWKRIYKLLEGVLNQITIGWNVGSGQHENGAQFLFSTPPSNKLSSISASKAGDQVIRFSLTAYDIDTNDELEVIVNGKSYGYIDTTTSNAFGSSQTVCISINELKPAGSDNVVSLKLKHSKETWGVKDVKFEKGVVDAACTLGSIIQPPFDLRVDNMELLYLKPSDSALTMPTIVRNIGTGTSPFNTLIYYLSDSPDKSNSIVLTSLPIAPIASGGFRNVASSSSSSRVKTGAYI